MNKDPGDGKTLFRIIKDTIPELSEYSEYLIVQLLFPFRYFLYPGELFWHEQGYRFSWRVMLMDKVGLDEVIEYANAYAIASHPLNAYYFFTNNNDLFHCRL